MKTEINSPSRSKINWTATAQAFSNLLAMLFYHWGWIPQNAMVPVMTLLNMAFAALIGVFRTWFTDPPA